MPSSNKRLKISGRQLKCLFSCIFIFTGSSPSCGPCQIKVTTSLGLILQIWYVVIFMFLWALFCNNIPVLSGSDVRLLYFKAFFICQWVGLCMCVCVFWEPYTSEHPENGNETSSHWFLISSTLKVQLKHPYHFADLHWSFNTMPTDTPLWLALDSALSSIYDGRSPVVLAARSRLEGAALWMCGFVRV